MSGRLLLGVDGGNTKTVALVAREDGTIVGAGRAGCSDHYGEITPAGAYDEIASSVRTALAAGGGQATDIASSCFSLAGADWPEDIVVYKRELAGRLQLPTPVVVVNDAIGALRAGTSDGVGIAVACGTGTAIGARAHDGRLWHVSHWGLPSYRFSLARGAIEAAVQAELGIDPPTLLQELVPASAGHRSVEDLLRAMSMLGVARPPLGHTAIALLDADARGDATSHRVIGEVARAIVDVARASAARVGLAHPSPVVLAGGLFRHANDALERAIVGNMPDSEVVRARFEPAVGALLLAFDELDIAPDPDRLERSHPPAALFASEAPALAAAVRRRS